MKYKLRTALITLIIITGWSFTVSAGAIRCTQCGMMVDMDSKFTTRIVQGENISYFCDIGDLFAYIQRKGRNNAGAGVRDYGTGEWIDSDKAFYVHDSNKFKTPMRWGFAAFKDKNTASTFGTPSNFNDTAHSIQ